MKDFIESVRAFVERVVRKESEYKISRRVLHTRSFLAEAIESIRVETTALDVKFVQAAGAECFVSLETEDSRDAEGCVAITTEIENAILTVRSSEKSFHDIELVVRVPRVGLAVDVVTIDGDVTVSKCKVKSLSISTESADITADGVICDEIKLSSRNGDVTALNIESKNKVRASSVNGDVIR